MERPALFTIGYEGSEIGRVGEALRGAGVAMLVDVRAVAGSRKPGFSKRQLAAGLAEIGISYVHLRALGTPKSGRIAARAGRIGEMRAIYAAHLEGDEAQAGLGRLRALAAARPCCLLCFEAAPHACHRLLVAEAVAGVTAQSVVHLHPAGRAGAV